MSLNNIQIAEICHEANWRYCEGIGDHSQVSWDNAPDWQKESAIDGVQAIRNNPNQKPSDSHDNWLKHKKSEGWVYGEIKDSSKKTHPCMVPYEELPVEQRIKDSLFLGIVNALLSGEE